MWITPKTACIDCYLWTERASLWWTLHKECIFFWHDENCKRLIYWTKEWLYKYIESWKSIESIDKEENK